MAELNTRRRRPLAICLAAALALNVAETAIAAAAAAALPPRALVGAPANPLPDLPSSKRRSDRHRPDHPAETRIVTNCNDGGPGSFRAAVIDAGDADVVDLSQLTCSTITLTTGYIEIDESPYIKGPGADALTIDGDHRFGVIQHFGQGALVVSGLTLANGYYQSSNVPFGGGLYSNHSVAMQDSVVRDCVAVGTGSVAALGGGIYTRGYLTLVRSTLSGNRVQSNASAYAKGGGAYAKGLLESNASTFDNNSALSNATSGPAGTGGGAFVLGQGIFYASTIYANQAQTVGGIVIGGVGADSPSLIADSTVSGNTSTASVYGAGIYAAAALALSSSTITGNVEAHAVDSAKYGAGLSLGSSATVDIESTIVYGNRFQDSEGELADDIGGHTTVALTGANNIIQTSLLPVPPDTIVSDPQLMPLGDYGGPTKTHALPASSPAIDAGNTVHFETWDQRGSGFARTSGARADIGAYEFQVQADTIFADGFD